MHPGEIAIQKRLNLFDPEEAENAYYSPYMPLQHQVFFSNLPYFIYGNVDKQGRPWVTILSGPPGFVASANQNTLVFDTTANKWDPVVRNLVAETTRSKKREWALFAGLGIDFSNRRRNKVAGKAAVSTVEVVESTDTATHIQFVCATQQSLGNCPKYINIRPLKYIKRADAAVVHKHLHENDAVLPTDAVDIVHQADAMFISTRHHHNRDDPSDTPSDMDVNIRGGPKGFVRITLDRKRIIWPDYSGNRFYQSLGNIESDKVAGLVFPNFTTGDLLYITGTAQNVIGEDAAAIMPSCNHIVCVAVTGYVYVRNGLNLELAGNIVQYSPYNPVVKYLAEEAHLYPTGISASSIMAVVSNIQQISQDIATFTFKLPDSHPVVYLPGQHALLDFSLEKKKRNYAHMDDSDPQSLNDDFIRSWTISSASPVSMSSENDPTTSVNTAATNASADTTNATTEQVCTRFPFVPSNSFSCTIKLKKGGKISTFLHNYAKIPLQERKELKIAFRGINGTFTPFAQPSPCDLVLTNRKLLFIAGGIGITPFMSFYEAVQKMNLNNLDFALLFAARDDDILIAEKYASLPSLKIFHTSTNKQPHLSLSLSPALASKTVTRRMTQEDLAGVEGLHQRTTYICGPDGFMKSVSEWLVKLGVSADNIKQESFTF